MTRLIEVTLELLGNRVSASCREYDDASQTTLVGPLGRSPFSSRPSSHTAPPGARESRGAGLLGTEATKVVINYGDASQARWWYDYAVDLALREGWERIHCNTESSVFRMQV
jgi:hypothetical protein